MNYDVFGSVQFAPTPAQKQRQNEVVPWLKNRGVKYRVIYSAQPNMPASYAQKSRWYIATNSGEEAPATLQEFTEVMNKSGSKVFEIIYQSGGYREIVAAAGAPLKALDQKFDFYMINAAGHPNQQWYPGPDSDPSPMVAIYTTYVDQSGVERPLDTPVKVKEGETLEQVLARRTGNGLAKVKSNGTDVTATDTGVIDTTGMSIEEQYKADPRGKRDETIGVRHLNIIRNALDIAFDALRYARDGLIEKAKYYMKKAIEKMKKAQAMAPQDGLVIADSDTIMTYKLAFDKLIADTETVIPTIPEDKPVSIPDIPADDPKLEEEVAQIEEEKKAVDKDDELSEGQKKMIRELLEEKKREILEMSGKIIKLPSNGRMLPLSRPVPTVPVAGGGGGEEAVVSKKKKFNWWPVVLGAGAVYFITQG